MFQIALLNTGNNVLNHLEIFFSIFARKHIMYNLRLSVFENSDFSFQVETVLLIASYFSTEKVIYKLNSLEKKLDINKYDKHLISKYIFIFSSLKKNIFIHTWIIYFRDN